MNSKTILIASALAITSAANAVVITAWNFNDATPTFNDGTTTATNGSNLLGSTPGAAASTGSGTFTTNAQAGTATAGGRTYRIGLGSLAGVGTTANSTTYTNAGLVVQVGYKQEFLNSTNTNAGSYLQFTTSTVGFDNIGFAYDTRSTLSSGSNSGFRNQSLSYSIDGTNFTQFSPTNVPSTAAYLTKSFDLSSLAGTANASSLTVRITLTDPRMSGTDNYAGNNRFDNVTFSGTQAVPEPATMAALGIGLVGILRRRARRSA